MTVVCFGDSNTYGYDPRSFLGDRYDSGNRWVDILATKTGWRIRNQGMNGREIPRNFVSFSEDTQLLIVMLGTNDLLQGNSPELVSDRMERFLSMLTIPLEKVVLIAPPALVRGEWVPNDELAESSVRLGELYKGVSERLGTRFINACDWRIPMCFDGVHFTENGHRCFAEGLLEYFALEDMLCLK